MQLKFLELMMKTIFVKIELDLVKIRSFDIFVDNLFLTLRSLRK